MEAFQPLRSIEHVPPVERKGPEERFWETFDEKTRIRLTGAVQGVHFSPLGSNQVAVTAESRVTILKSSTGDLIKSFPRTDTVAYAGRYRTDGKLLVAGTESGLVHLYNAHSRSILRTFSGHKSSVRSVYFTIDKLRVVSASDDMTVRVTDIPSEQCLLSLHHADRVRAQTPCPASPHLWLTGCYDGAVRLFDLRLPSQKPVRMVWHAQHGQVDDVCFLDSESSTFVASGGGSSVRCWELLHSSSDVEAGSQRALLAELEPHRKAVMSLALDATRRRLLSVSLDGALKVHDLSVLSTLHTRSIGAGCLCMDLSADGRSLATGHVDGQLRIERRGVSKPSGIENETNVDERSGEPDWASLARGHLDRGDALRPYRPGTRRYFLRGMYAKPDSDIDDVILGDGDSTSGTSRRRRRQHDQKPYDHHLRRFAYDKALSAVLETNQSGLIVSMLVELDRRKGLQNALSSLNEQQMITLIEFIAKHIADSRYIQVLVPVSHLIVDMHHTKDSLSGSLLAALQRLAARVQQQVHHLGDMEKMAAAIELFLS